MTKKKTNDAIEFRAPANLKWMVTQQDIEEKYYGSKETTSCYIQKYGNRS